ncbi:hypothetical protein N5D09_22480, partial [Stutzerimonas stutzeri]
WKKQGTVAYIPTTVWFVSSQDGTPYPNCESQAGGKDTIGYWLSCGSRACRSLGYTVGQLAEKQGNNISDVAVLQCQM